MRSGSSAPAALIPSAQDSARISVNVTTPGTVAGARAGTGAAAVRKPLVLGLALAAVLLALLGFRLSSDGLWDPYEVRYLEQLSDASNPISGQPLWQPLAGNRSRILMWPLALGTKIFGFNELGARLPMWGLATLLLLSVAGFALWLRSMLGALIAPLVLATTPLFFMSARLASQGLLPLLAQLWAVWGLSMMALPRRRSPLVELFAGLVLSGAGLTVGGFATGTLVGVGVPVGAVALAIMLGDGVERPGERGQGSAAREAIALAYGLLFGFAVLPMVRIVIEHSMASPGTASASTTALRLQVAAAGLLTAAAALLAGGRRALPLVVAAATVAVGVLPAGPVDKTTGFSPWLAGSLHFPGTREVQVDTLLRGLGFAFFPWSAILPAAIAGLFTAAARSAETGPSTGTEAQPAASSIDGDGLGLAERLALCWFGLGYLLTTLHNSFVVELPFVALVAPVLLVSGYIERRLQEGRGGGVLAGICVGLCAVIVGRDFFFSPELFLSGAFGEPLRWPSPMAWVGQGLLGGALLWGALLAIALWVRGHWRIRAWGAVVVLALLSAGLSIHGLCPQLSRHVSYRGLYTRYRQLGGGKLALFSVQQASGKIYGQEASQLYTLPELMSFLAGQAGERTFAIVGSGELGGIDREAHLRGLQYYMVDDSNAQYVLLSNRLLPGEQDLNPLRRLVSSVPPQPRVPVHVTFDERIELVGYDAPPEINRGEELVIRLYYRVLAPVPMNYRVFLHFDGPGARFNGDHTPVGGKFQTTYWSPGTYITDEHRMPIGRMSQAPGYYQIFTGFWPGGDGQRMTVTSGPHEPDQRVRIGAIRVK